VVRKALTRGPQRVTIRGKLAAVIMSPDEFVRLRQAKQRKRLVAFLQGLGLDELTLVRQPGLWLAGLRSVRGRLLVAADRKSRLPNPAVRVGMATPVGATGSKVRFARQPPRTPKSGNLSAAVFAEYVGGPKLTGWHSGVRDAL
jgi:hypothetical protein